MRAELARACPQCQGSPLELRWGLVARPLGTWSLAGAQLKTSAVKVAEVHCPACGATVTGHLEGATFSDDGSSFTGGHFVADAPPVAPGGGRVAP